MVCPCSVPDLNVKGVLGFASDLERCFSEFVVLSRVFNSRLCSRDLSVCVACVERWSSAAARVLDFNAAFFVCFLVSKLGVGVRSLVR